MKIDCLYERMKIFFHYSNFLKFLASNSYTNFEKFNFNFWNH
jgi:hypothetical protein